MVNAFGSNKKTLTRLRTGMLVALVAISSMLPANAIAIPNPFFTGRWQSHSDLSAFTKWTAVMPRYQSAKAAVDVKCTEENCKNQQWEKLLTLLKGKDVKQQLDAVNTFFNAMPYIEDTDNYGMTDYWQTPYELMEKGGDCEDYAIAKYISLKRLGIGESQMRVMIVQDNNLGGIMHAILEVKVGGTTYLLDNQATKVTTANKVFHYRPIYAINTQAWWAYQ